MQNKKRYKLAIVAPVPFYYHVPLYRKLASSQEIDLKVYYCSQETIHGDEVRKTYQTKKQPIEEDLLRGYEYKFLKNYSLSPSFLKWPFGLVNIGIYNEIKNGNYDAVVLQSWTNLVWWLAFFACMRFKTDIIFMTDSNVSSEVSKPKIKKYIKKLILGKFLFKNASGFFTSGIANEEFYKYYGVPERKMVRLYFSWGYEKFIVEAERLKSERINIRNSLGIKEDDFVVLYVGRLSPEKSPLCLLKAFSEISIKSKKIFFVGDGILRSKIEQKVKDLKIKEVFIEGFQPRKLIPKFYTAADVFVLPSLAETWGIVVNEAMCFNLPIIISKSVGAGSDLIKNGYNGFVFKSGDVEDLSIKMNLMANLSKEERAAFGARSKETIVKWINDIDPVRQINKMLEIVKNNSF